MENQRFFAGLGLVSVSLVLHGSLFFSLGRAVNQIQEQTAYEQKNILKARGERLEFQFIEAPPKVPSHNRSAKAKKISSHDALNQDTLKNRSNSAVPPHTVQQGRADQLAQHRGDLSQTPSPRVEPSRGVQKEEETEKKKEEIALAVSAPAEKIFLVREKTKSANGEDKSPNNQKPNPLVRPKSEIRGTGGLDRITTQEMGKIKSPGAMLFGQTSFQATGSGMGEYMKRLKEKIWLSWFPYLATQYPQDFRGADVVVSFTLDPKGDVKIVRVLDSVGSPVFASYCVEAIQKASGFGPLPEEILGLIGKDELEIKFGFHYR